MIQELNLKLNATYNYLTKEHNVPIPTIDIFKRYLWQIDAIRLKLIYTPFIWEDYIFIDKLDVYKLDKFSYKDSISEMDKDIIDFVIKKDDSVLREKYELIDSKFINELKSIIDNAPYQRNLTINHHDFLSRNDVVSYYNEQREIYFIFKFHKYEIELIQRRRDLKLKELIR